MSLELVHEIPGRLRLRASKASLSVDNTIVEALQTIVDVTLVKFNPNTKSLLITYCSFTARDIVFNVLFKKKLIKTKPAPLKQKLLPSTTTCANPTEVDEAPVSNPIPGYLFRKLLPMPLRIGYSLLSSIPYLYEGVCSLSKGQLNLDVLDASALAVCLASRDYLAAGTITFFFALGEFLESWTRKKSRASLTKSLALNIEHIWIREDDIERSILLEDVKPGDHVVIRAGATIPVDGTVLQGNALVNQSSMTGEPLPVQRTVGSSVYAGTVITEGMLVVKAIKVGNDMRISSIIRFVEESEERKATIENRYEHIADAIVPYNFLLAFLVFAITRDPIRAGSVLLVDYSCAIRLGTPLTVLSAMRESADKGVLIKGGKFMEALAEADTVVFDKTGTLTQAKPQLIDVISFGALSTNNLLKIAACLEEHFVHPVGQAVVRAAEEKNLAHREEHTEVEFIVAHGLVSRLNGKRVLIGSEHFILEDEKIPVTKEQQAIIDKQTALGRSVLYLAIDQCLEGVLLIEDSIREETPRVIEQLRQNGIKRILMLTGDGELTAKAIAEKAGIIEYKAKLLPEDKARIINKLKQDGCKVVMIGDGMNDSPALSAADVGVAMVDGADIAREIADIVLTRGYLEDLLMARQLSQNAMQRIQNSFRTSVTLNSLFLTGGLLGVLTPMLSAVLHNLTTAGIALGSMRPVLNNINLDNNPLRLPDQR